MKVPGRLDWEWAPLEMDEGGRERAIEIEALDAAGGAKKRDSDDNITDLEYF